MLILKNTNIHFQYLEPCSLVEKPQSTTAACNQKIPAFIQPAFLQAFQLLNPALLLKKEQ